LGETNFGQIFQDAYRPTWVLYQKASGTPLYCVTGNFAPKTVYVTDDGLSLAVVDDYSSALPADSLEVVSFYHLGNKVRGYRLDQVLCSTNNISSSASHFRWFAHLRFLPGQQQLTLTTYELTSLTFNLTTGALASQQRSPLLTKTAQLVYGEVKRVGTGTYDMSVCHRVYGQVPPNGHVRFASKHPLRGYVTVLVDNGQHVAGEKTTNWILNECSYRYRLEQKRSSTPVDTKLPPRSQMARCP
jgi:hypothetical protein